MIYAPASFQAQSKKIFNGKFVNAERKFKEGDLNKIKSLVFLLFVSLVLVQVGCSKEDYAISKEDEIEEGTSIIENNNLTLDNKPIYLEDALNLVSVVEDTHPSFVMGDIGENYEEGKQEFLNSITQNTSKDEFKYLIRKYLVLLQDGHTGIQRNESDDFFLNLEYYAIGEELLLLDKDGNISDNKVTKVGGVPINKIYETVQTYYTAENDAARERNNNMWTLNYEVLKLAGCDIINNSVDIITEQNGLVSEGKIKFIKKNIYESYEYSSEIESKMINDIFYIDMNVCKDNNILDKQVEKLKETIKSGCRKVIIDVRDNPGGNSAASEKLINAMDMSVPTYGVYVRYSELVNKKYSEAPLDGFEHYKPNKTTAKGNENIDLAILMNDKTFSSATMLAVFVKDGELGTLIGSPSSNAPSSYGDILYYRLPNSKIDLTISFKKFLRPDTEADQRILIPDIVTEYNADILEIAIDYLSTK